MKHLNLYFFAFIFINRVLIYFRKIMKTSNQFFVLLFIESKKLNVLSIIHIRFIPV